MRCNFLHGIIEAKNLETYESINCAPFVPVCFGSKPSHKPTVDEISKYCDCNEVKNAYESCNAYMEGIERRKRKLDV